MSNLTGALIVVLCINGLLFLGQASINSLGGNVQYYNETSGTCMNANPVDSLPQTGQSVDPDTGLSYTDDYSTGKNFLKGDSGKCTTSIMTAPANFMKYLGTPTVFNWAIMVIWYGITLFLFVSWLLGRDA